MEGLVRQAQEAFEEYIRVLQASAAANAQRNRAQEALVAAMDAAQVQEAMTRLSRATDVARRASTLLSTARARLNIARRARNAHEEHTEIIREEILCKLVEEDPARVTDVNQDDVDAVLLQLEGAEAA